MRISWALAAAVILTTVSRSTADPSPEVVGIYTGTLSATIHDSVGKRKAKMPMQVQIGSDSSTTVTLAGIQQTNAMGVYSGVTGVFTYEAPVADPIQGMTLGAVSYKKNKLTGACTGYLLNDGPPSVITETLEGKIKLKRVSGVF